MKDNRLFLARFPLPFPRSRAFLTGFLFTFVKKQVLERRVCMDARLDETVILCEFVG